MKKITDYFTTKLSAVPDEGSIGAAEDKVIKILIIGHSFTTNNKMFDNYFKKICAAAGIEATHDMVVVSDILQRGINPGDKLYVDMHAHLKADKKYDFTIVQDMSRCPMVFPTYFYAGIRNVASLAKENGGELWFSQTWGYNEGHPNLYECGGSTEVMEKILRASYDVAAEEVGAKVTHVGEAVQLVNTNPEFKPSVYVEDCFHPSIYGSIITAWTTFASLFGIDPMTVDYDCGIGEEELRIIKEAAKKAAFSHVPSPEEYIEKAKSIAAK